MNKKKLNQNLKPERKQKLNSLIPKEPVEPIVHVAEEPVVEVVEEVAEQPKKVDKLKQIVKCPDCSLEMTQHALKYIHKRRGFCEAEKAVTETPVIEKAPEQPKPKIISEDFVNDYIKDHPDIVSSYIRNERAMKAQRKQMNAKSLLNSA